MEEHITVLLIENNPDDAARIIKQLKKSMQLHVSRVDTPQQAFDMLDRETPDILISEYATAEGGALDVLARLKENQINIPLIVVSDMLDPIIATDVMKAGAADYVIKCKLARLPFAVEKTLAIRKSNQETAQPITANIIQQLESRVAQRTAELESCTRKLNKKTGEVEELKQQLKIVEKKRSEFISVISHDLRAPLTSIVGFAETMLTTDMNLTEEEKQRFLEIIKDEGKRLGEFIGSFVEVSKIENKEMNLELSEIGLFRMLHEVIDSMDSGGAMMLIPDDYRQEIVLQADENRLRRVFSNILNDILDSTPDHGTVSIFVEENDSNLEVAISSSKSRLDSSDRARLFNRLNRGQIERWSQKRRGTELKMSIAKAFVNAHGGELWYEPHGDSGKTFFVQLPIHIPKAVSK